MEKVAQRVMLACVAVVSLCASATTFAQGGGNGNGGSGGGGAHGAATAGMTYHSEPVSSPWNARPGKMTKNADTTQMGMHGMSPDDSAQPAKTGQ